MFMFRSKRHTLSKRLVEEYRKRAKEQTNDERLEVGTLLRRLQEKQLQMLLSAVTSRGQDSTNCVLLPREDEPHVLCCRAWRWPDLRQASELRRMPMCRSAADSVYICCNPYHWSRLCLPDYPPPPYSVCAMDTLRPEVRGGRSGPGVSGDRVHPTRQQVQQTRVARGSQPHLRETPPTTISGRSRRDNIGTTCFFNGAATTKSGRWKREGAPLWYTCPSDDRAPSEAPLVCRNSTPGSLTTSGEDSIMNSMTWCKLAYWEMGQRVGPLYPVEQPAVNVFGQVPYGDGLSLETLARHCFSPTDSVVRTRDKIGLGVTISREGDSVWVYNRSDSPIFVSSLSLEDHETSSPTRVPADGCLCIFDPVRATHNNNHWTCRRNQNFGPVDHNSVRLSFVKGWGPRYSRQEITSCPCWLEILLSPCR